MKVIIGATTYTDIKSLRFAPQADVTGITTPINEFSVDILTENPLTPGAYAELYDDLDNLWAKYWITDSVKVNVDTLRITAKSLLYPLDRVELPAEMYDATPVATALGAIFQPIGGQYTLDTSFASATLTGFCPEQTARERLQWICFVLGAYVKTHFCPDVQILPVPTEDKLIPMNKTYWRPEVSSRAAVAEIRAKAWTYTEGTPATTDQWVTDGTTTWIAEEQWVSLHNPAVGQLSPSSVVSIEDVGLIHSGNVGGILSRLSGYYFKPKEIALSIINNAEFLPGEKVQAYMDPQNIVDGWIDTATFTFGVQAKSVLHVTAIDNTDSGTLTILYMYESIQLGKAVYTLPVGYVYSIENPYIDMTMTGHRYIFRPLNEAAEGTITAAGTVDEEPYAVALDQTTATGELYIISVDELEQNEEGEVILS